MITETKKKKNVQEKSIQSIQDRIRVLEIVSKRERLLTKTPIPVMPFLTIFSVKKRVLRE